MSDWADPARDDLKARIVSGVLMATIGVGAIWAGGPWLAAAAGAALTAMAFEFARMSEAKAPVAGFAVSVAGGLCGIWAASWGELGGAAAAIALAACLTALRPQGLGRRMEAAFGALYVGLPCAAFVWLRGTEHGLAIAIALLGIIIAADVAAYFAGRFVGGPRLAPSLSPNKTWSGIAGGVLAGAGAGAIFWGVHGGPAGLWIGLGGALAGLGLGGDLFESLVKRRYGVKDASNLIPGHGGVLDRLDGLMFAATAAALLVALFPGAPDALFRGRT